MKYLITTIFTLFTFSLLAQSGIIRGSVTDEITNEAVPFANVVIQGTDIGASTDFDGNFEINGLTPGTYNIVVSYIGFKNQLITELQVTNARPVQLNIQLSPSELEIEEAEITASPFEKKLESPVSLRSIGAAEIERFPGANRDISKVLLAFPGVTTTVAYRNDLIIRGGSPNENRFYLDGIEIPNINHFATQGASGGSNGLINVDFIEDVEFYSGAFPANRGNALSSVFNFSFKEGRTDRLSSRLTVAATEAGISLEGPLSKNKKTTFITSFRRSYAQLLFKAFGLPFLPTYNDFQFKIKSKINSKNDLTVIGLGAIDDFKLNLEANETDDQLYLLGRLPYIQQQSYTIGARYRHFMEKSYLTVVMSRSQVFNDYKKYEDNENDNPNALIFDLNSNEAENKLRVEHTTRFDGFKLNVGVNYELARYYNQTTNRVPTNEGIINVNYTSVLDLNKWGVFFQLSRAFMEERLSLSFGLRADATDYSSYTNDILEQISPRFSASYAITSKWDVNFNVGRYYQLPPYTTLGFRNNAGDLVNQQLGLDYVANNHIVLGTSYTTSTNTKFSIEGFYKLYQDYAFLLNDSIPLANVGGDFGVFGDQPATSSIEGRSYGLEFMAQQKYYNGWYGIASYTIFKSEFRDKTGQYVSSSWDVGHSLSLSGGKELKKNWSVGMRFNITGGTPYTAYDLETSSLAEVWDANGEGIRDWDNLNQERTRIAQQLDFRVDKNWYFDKWNLNLYLDIRNVYAAKFNDQAYVDVVRDQNGQPLRVPGSVPLRYQLRRIQSGDALVTPSLGIVVEI